MLVPPPLLNHETTISTLLDDESSQNQQGSFKETEDSAMYRSLIGNVNTTEQSTPLKSAIMERLKKNNFSSPVARNLLQQQENLRSLREENQEMSTMILVEASSEQHLSVFITPGSFRLVLKELGKGSEGVVHAVQRQFNDTNKPDEKEAIKRLNRLPINDGFTSISSGRLNLPMQRYKLKNSEDTCQTLPLGEGDLSTFDFNKTSDPIQTYLGYIQNIAEGAACLHSNNIIHRDIKPQNIIVISQNSGAQLGDLDTAIKEKKKPHQTTCTPIYTPPSIWSNNIDKQACRKGIQTKSDDVFSLGRTLQYGLIKKIFSLYPQTTEQAKSLEWKMVQLPSDEIEAKNLLNSFLIEEKIINVLNSKKIKNPSKPNKNKIIPNQIVVFPSKNELKAITDEGLRNLKGVLTASEYEALNHSALLADKMQDDNPGNRPTMNEIYNKIANLKKLSPTISAMESPPPFLSKRKIDLQDQSTPPKMESPPPFLSKRKIDLQDESNPPKNIKRIYCHNHPSIAPQNLQEDFDHS